VGLSRRQSIRSTNPQREESLIDSRQLNE
jgi:hypothetical protein